MQKKLGIIGATVAALFALAACSSSTSSSEEAAPAPAKTIAIIFRVNATNLGIDGYISS